MNVQKRYHEILSALKVDKRPLPALEKEIIEEIKKEWQQVLSTEPLRSNKLTPFLCLLSNTKTLTDDFDPLLFSTLKNKKLENQTIVMTLGALHRQILDRCQRTGEMPPRQLNEVLKTLLNNKNPEVFEWCLRTVEAMGSGGVYLKEEILGRKPNKIAALLSRRKRTARYIIETLEQRWKPYGARP